MKLSSALLALLSIATPIYAQGFLHQLNSDPKAVAHGLNINVEVEFLDDETSSAGLGPAKLTNGIHNKLSIGLVNNEDKPLGVSFIGGSLWNSQGTNIRNLTQQILTVEVQPEERADIPYSIFVDMHPQEITLRLGLIVKTADDRLLSVDAYNATVAVVEQPMSILDPQM